MKKQSKSFIALPFLGFQVYYFSYFPKFLPENL